MKEKRSEKRFQWRYIFFFPEQGCLSDLRRTQNKPEFMHDYSIFLSSYVV